MEINAWTTSLALVIIYAASRVQKIFNGKRAVGNIPGMVVLFEPYNMPGGAFPTTKWNPGLAFVWRWRSFLYRQYNSDTISIVPFVMGAPTVLTSDLDVARQLLSSSKISFGKKQLPERNWINYWGKSIITSVEDDLWRKHRRIVGPAFSQKLYELVWSQSLQLYYEMLSGEGFEHKMSIDIPRAQKLTFKFAFYIIGRCGFDFPFKWSEDIESLEGVMSFAEAMRCYIEYVMALNLPESILKLPVPAFKKLDMAITEIRKFMDNKVLEKEEEVRNSAGQQQGNDIFSALIQANVAEGDSKLKLDYSEVIGNVFIMLFAGHETTAHTLAGALACLARYPAAQNDIVEQVLSVVGTDRDPTFDDYQKLNKVQACFYEALRMFPTAYIVMREAKQDCILNIPNASGEGSTPVPIEKGTQTIIDMVGIHKNPRYFDDPEIFQPSRWYDVSNESEAIPGFGLGPRSCIGRKFAITEAVCFLTMVLRDFKVEPLTSPGQSVDEWFEGVSNCSALLTLAVGDVPVRFVRRA